MRPLGGPALQVRARRYVVACGTIENARLLLDSSDVEPHGIGNRHDQVGRFFMEHPAGRIARVDTPQPFEMWCGVPQALRAGRDADRAGAAAGRGGAGAGAGAQRHRHDEAAARPQARRDAEQRAVQRIKHSVDPTRSGRALDHCYRGVRAWLQAHVRDTDRAGGKAKAGRTSIYLITRGEQAPNPDSRVLLSDERDALGNPPRQSRLAAAGKSTSTASGCWCGRSTPNCGGWARARRRPSEWLDDPDPQWPVDPTVGNHPLANYHQMGGTRMSGDPKTGVVDADCRVHGYDNLYVAGSSVFPTGGWANPTLTIIAMSLRLAEHLDGSAATSS